MVGLLLVAAAATERIATTTTTTTRNNIYFCNDCISSIRPLGQTLPNIMHTKVIRTLAALFFLCSPPGTVTQGGGGGAVDSVQFQCPEEFGYFPHPNDCSQYYVCVFGGALLESCTGGLMYSHELQTCDWPRNVFCNGTDPLKPLVAVSPSALPPPQNLSPRFNIRPSISSTATPLYAYKPIEVDTFGKVTELAAGQTRFQDDNNADSSRQGRSYEGNIPDYKEEIRGRRRQRRDILSNFWDKFRSRPKRRLPDILPAPRPPLVNYYYNPSSSSSSSSSSPSAHRNFNHFYYEQQQKLLANKYRHTALSQPPPSSGHNSMLSESSKSSKLLGRGPNPGVEMYPSSYYTAQQKPTVIQNIIYGKNYVNYNQFPPTPTTSTHKPPLDTGQLQDFPTRSSIHSTSSSRPLTPPHHHTQNYDYNNYDNDDDYNTSDEPDYYNYNNRSVSNHPKLSKRPQEIVVDNGEYLAQRYAANVNATPYNNIRQQQQQQQQQQQVQQQQQYEDESYYIYDDQGEEPQYDDVDYKTPFLVATTRRPLATTTTSTFRPQRIRQPTQQQQPNFKTAQQQQQQQQTSRGTLRQKSSSSGRPTLKPKHSIVKDSNQQVRDVYLDAPSRPYPVYETPVPNTPSTKCRKDLCVLPDCSCGGKEIPGGLRPQDTPQIVLLTFDDSVNDLNKNLYRDLFEKGRKNSNGCPISATFYVSHEWTDYSQVQNLAADGHEIASHSVSHSFGEQFSQKKWDKEVGGQREILAAYGGVKLSDVRGMRAPFLAIGGNNMFKMLHDSNFTYDSSMPVYENRPPSWPYTLDYRIFHDCMIPPCPTKSYPGVWEVPMVMWTDLKGGRCSMGDACSNPPNAEGVYQMLAKNFERHYTTNRAPFGLYYHAAWFTTPHHKEGFEAFLDSLVQMDDVWLVTNWQALEWMRNPTPLNKIHTFQPWSCHNQDRPPRCNHPKVCNLWHKSGVRYMKTCQHCPQQYPWTGNTGVPFTNSL